MDRHVRAKCPATGAVAALPEQALDLGMFPGWVKVDGPVPDKPKPSISTKKTADNESADEKEV